MTNAIGLKYSGKREEGISVMLFRSYKTIKLNKLHPYRFTGKDIVTPEALNYYRKLENLGVFIITDEKDLLVNPRTKLAVRREPMIAEVDTQIDVTSEAPQESDTPATVSVANSEPSGEIIESVPADSALGNSNIPKDMSQGELSEYLEMNLSKDQLKTLISDLGLNISTGRKNSPAIVSEIISSADTAALIDYLNK